MEITKDDVNEFLECVKELRDSSQSTAAKKALDYVKDREDDDALEKALKCVGQVEILNIVVNLIHHTLLKDKE